MDEEKNVNDEALDSIIGGEGESTKKWVYSISFYNQRNQAETYKSFYCYHTQDEATREMEKYKEFLKGNNCRVFLTRVYSK